MAVYARFRPRLELALIASRYADGMKKRKERSRGINASFATQIEKSARTVLVASENPILPISTIHRDPNVATDKAEVDAFAPAASAFAPSSSAEAKIRALRAASNLAIATGDLFAIPATLAANFSVIIGDGTQLSRAAYLEAFASIFKQAAPVRYQRIPDTIHISTSQPVAAEHGHWIGTLPDGTVTSTGTYMAMWRRASSRWQLRSELFVTLA